MTITSYTERARLAREEQETYVVDQGQRCQCTCGDVHFRRKEADGNEETEVPAHRDGVLRNEQVT